MGYPCDPQRALRLFTPSLEGSIIFFLRPEVAWSVLATVPTIDFLLFCFQHLLNPFFRNSFVFTSICVAP
jgi:hypothetical protein